MKLVQESFQPVLMDRMLAGQAQKGQFGDTALKHTFQKAHIIDITF